LKKYKILKILIIPIILVILFFLGIFIYAKISPKLNISKANSILMYDSENRIFNNSDSWINLEDISPYLIDATISIEDKNFYKHNGFDYLRILKALFINITNGKTLQGASTITQQYAKNLFLEFDRKWSRKVEEALLTVRIEDQYSKNEILEGYLNTINYGGVFGIENASLYYFNKSSSELTLAEASILAGIPKSPANYSPISNYENAKSRQWLILDSMVKNKYITEEEAKKAYDTELVFIGSSSDIISSGTLYFEDAVLKELKTIKSIPNSSTLTSGLKIYTTLDAEAQKIVDDTINNYLNDSKLEISTVLMNPTNGNILAIAGGKDYSNSQFNRVTSSYRQVGSTMKPFLYYAALENGFTASTTFTSEKTTFTIGNNKTYSPTNYAENYANKEISMAAAIAYSDNIYAVKTHLFLGEDTLVETAKKLGITSSLDSIPSLALGTNEINILEMMEAYGTFANEGYKIEPHFIQKIEDSEGNILYEYKEKKDKILDKSTVFILNNLLNNSYAKEFIDYTYPTCITIAPKLTKKYAIKTGTTNTDHLIFGYNPDAVLGIWMGYDDNSPTLVSDGNIMKNIWADIIENYLRDKEEKWYSIPKNVVGVLAEPISGELAIDKTKSKMFYYIKGTQPIYEDALSTIIPSANWFNFKFVIECYWDVMYMYKRSFNIKHLPPVTLESLQNYYILKYKTNNVTIIEVNQKYYLIKDVDDILTINKNFFDFLIEDVISKEEKTIYILPLSNKLNIIFEKINETIKISVYFKTKEEALKFEIPNFFGEELILEKHDEIDSDIRYVDISNEDIIFLVANFKEIEIDENTKNELFRLYYKIKDDKNLNKKIQIKEDSKILSLLQSTKTKVKKRWAIIFFLLFQLYHHFLNYIHLHHQYLNVIQNMNLHLFLNVHFLI